MLQTPLVLLVPLLLLVFCVDAADPCEARTTPPLDHGNIACSGTSIPSGGTCIVACDIGYSPAPAMVTCTLGKFSSATCSGE
jgi:hypothetical protein